MTPLEQFSKAQLKIVNEAVATAEEIVSNYYKLSISQWRRPKYDVKTLADLSENEIVRAENEIVRAQNEIVHGPFAQIVRYQGQKKDSSLSSSAYDFYKICLQDHSVISALRQSIKMPFFPFILYIITHELIHVVRFSNFSQNFEASPEEKLAEETRVHKHTNKILVKQNFQGMSNVISFYHNWQ